LYYNSWNNTVHNIDLNNDINYDINYEVDDKNFEFGNNNNDKFDIDSRNNDLNNPHIIGLDNDYSDIDNINYNNIDVDDIINDNYDINNRNYDNVDNNISDPIDSIIIVNNAFDNNDNDNNYFINGKDVICAFAFLICDVNLDNLSRKNEIISKFRLRSKPGM
jgi:hypothetical protein